MHTTPEHNHRNSLHLITGATEYCFLRVRYPPPQEWHLVVHPVKHATHPRADHEAVHLPAARASSADSGSFRIRAKPEAILARRPRTATSADRREPPGKPGMLSEISRFMSINNAS
jgi:hypothetical protein